CVSLCGVTPMDDNDVPGFNAERPMPPSLNPLGLPSMLGWLSPRFPSGWQRVDDLTPSRADVGRQSGFASRCHGLAVEEGRPTHPWRPGSREPIRRQHLATVGKCPVQLSLLQRLFDRPPSISLGDLYRAARKPGLF